MLNITKTISNEVSNYIDKVVNLGLDGSIPYSEYKIKKRILIYKNENIPTGKVSKDGEYITFPNITEPRVNDVTKNLRFDSKNILIYSENPIKDFPPVYTANLYNRTVFMPKKKTDQEIKRHLESFVSDGNWLAEKTSDGYNVLDLLNNTFLSNVKAETVDDTAIIHRELLSQEELREKKSWANVDDVIEHCGNKFHRSTLRQMAEPLSYPLYEIFTRDGSVSKKDLREAQKAAGMEVKEGKEEEERDDKKFVLAKIKIAAGKFQESGESYVLFAEEYPKNKKLSDRFVEAHYGHYEGRWWRKGVYEMLFDTQWECGQVSNRIDRGLEWAGKVVFKSSEAQILNSIRTQVKNGQIVKSADLAQVDVRLRNLDQLIARWNMLQEFADRRVKTPEVTQGEMFPSNTPMGQAQIVNINAGKHFVTLRKEFTSAYSRMFEQFVLPEMVKELKGKDIIRVTGDDTILDGFRQMAVDAWYMKNLVAIGPHTREMADDIKRLKIEEMKRLEPVLKNTKEIWEGVLPRLKVTVTGQNTLISENLQLIASMLPFEQDPIRRAFLTDMVYASRGLKVPPPAQLQPQPQIQPEQPSRAPTGKQIDTIGAPLI